MYVPHTEYVPMTDARRAANAEATAIGRARALAPFRFEDLNGRPEPESWGPRYTKPAKPGKVRHVEPPTNAPSGQPYGFCEKKHRAKLRAEFAAQANADRLAWATGKLSLDRVGMHGGIVEAYKQAMREKRAREAAELARRG
jgi:hypothetical protein